MEQWLVLRMQPYYGLKIHTLINMPVAYDVYRQTHWHWSSSAILYSDRNQYDRCRCAGAMRKGNHPYLIDITMHTAICPVGNHKQLKMNMHMGRVRCGWVWCVTGCICNRVHLLQDIVYITDNNRSINQMYECTPFPPYPKYDSQY